LQVAVIVCTAVGFRYDVVNGGCGYRLTRSQALLANVVVTLQDTSTDNIPLTAVSSLMSALPALMLLPAFMPVGFAVT